ncbi:MAG: gas vesicle protein [Myxococcaceae bacterium]|nr:gas vesicle protein [Myxococcaceae bacterium]
MTTRWTGWMTAQRIVQSPRSLTLADVLERVLDKGLVVAGDIKIKLLDVERLTFQVRLVVCSVEKAVEMGMDFWRTERMEALPPCSTAAASTPCLPERAPLLCGAPGN